MVTYKLTIQYLGTEYAGFQIQNRSSFITVQGKVQNVLSRIFDEEIKTVVAGRTDSGVHALGQVVSFTANNFRKPARLIYALNKLLPGDITVNGIELMDDSFHARYSALRRNYLYILDNSAEPSALYHNRAFWMSRKLDLPNMKKAIRLFKGTHDFALFAKNIKEAGTTIRSVDEAEIFAGNEVETSISSELIKKLFEPRKDFIYFRFTAPSFLHSQVR
ncbi:MAG: tRNA pseudouridine(38-40) synthase TruA, partial [Vulcanimicrobiota bacterium]